MILVGVAAVAAVGALLYAKARSGNSGADLNDIDGVLAEVEIYLGYGRKKQAVSLLERALEVNQGHAQLSRKLHQVKLGNS
jgi:hypothetical protein